MASSTGTKRSLQDEHIVSKKIKIDNFVDVITSDTCFLCSEDLSDCIDSIGDGISSYKCRCTRQRIVHSKCWTQEFKCTCGVEAVPSVGTGDLNSRVKKEVEDSYSAIHDSLEKTQVIQNNIRAIDFEDYCSKMSSFFRMLERANVAPSILERARELDMSSRNINRRMRNISGNVVGVRVKSSQVMANLACAKAEFSVDGEYFPSSPAYSPLDE